MKTLFIAFFIFFGHLTYSQTILLKAKNFYDSEEGVLKKDIEVLIKNNRIIEVGKQIKIDSSSTQIIDFGDATLTPGLIDSHTHLFIEEELHQDYAGFGEAVYKTLLTKSDATRTLEALKRGQSYLNSGFTTIRDLGNSGNYLDVDLRNAINNRLVTGPRMYVSGPGIAALGGQLNSVNHDYMHLVKEEYDQVTNDNAITESVQKHVLMKVDLIKVYADNIPNRTKLNHDQVSKIVDEAKFYNKNVTAHAITNDAVWRAAISDVSSIEHVYNVNDSTLNIIKEKEIAVIPTFSSREISIELFKKYRDFDSIQLNRIVDRSIKGQQSKLLRLHNSGVKLAFGSDFYSKISMSRGESALSCLIGWIESGIPVETVLKYATHNGAQVIDKNAKFGVIKKGYYADIVVFKGNIKDDYKLMKECLFVMKDGEIIKNKS